MDLDSVAERHGFEDCKEVLKKSEYTPRSLMR